MALQSLLAVVMLAMAFPAFAKTPVKPVKRPLPPRVTAQAWIVADAATGKVLASYRPDAQRSIASLTKLMTYRVAQDAGVDMTQVVSMASDDEVGGGRLRLPVGTPLTVQDVTAAMLVASANNSANALARVTGLSRTDFVAEMNATASSTGLMHTHFTDPTGIDPGNVSTAREVLAMSLHDFSDPTVATMTSSTLYPIAIADGSAPPHPIGNANLLVYDPAVKVVAGKTGFNYEAGYAVSTQLARAGKRDLLVVVLGTRTRKRSFTAAKALANWAWNHDLR